MLLWLDSKRELIREVRRLRRLVKRYEEAFDRSVEREMRMSANHAAKVEKVQELESLLSETERGQ